RALRPQRPPHRGVPVQGVRAGAPLRLRARPPGDRGPLHQGRPVMQDLWAVLLIALGGLLLGGAISTWKNLRLLAAVLAVCAVLAAASGSLRLGYFSGWRPAGPPAATECERRWDALVLL